MGGFLLAPGSADATIPLGLALCPGCWALPQGDSPTRDAGSNVVPSCRGDSCSSWSQLRAGMMPAPPDVPTPSFFPTRELRVGGWGHLSQEQDCSHRGTWRWQVPGWTKASCPQKPGNGKSESWHLLPRRSALPVGSAPAWAVGSMALEPGGLPQPPPGASAQLSLLSDSPAAPTPLLEALPPLLGDP